MNDDNHDGAETSATSDDELRWVVKVFAPCGHATHELLFDGRPRIDGLLIEGRLAPTGNELRARPFAIRVASTETVVAFVAPAELQESRVVVPRGVGPVRPH